jgi:mono/diheme cytochrome c family protein
MLKRLLLTAMAVTLAAAMGYADQSTKKIVIPVDRTSPTDGRMMYTSYCAPCHGIDGRGYGPAAPALRAVPTDLTGLAKANHGKFPDSHIITVLQFGSEIPAHGSAQMPVWGPILGKMNQVNAQDRQLRMSNLSRYLESIQVK